MMQDKTRLEDWINQTLKFLPDDLKQAHQDLEKNFRVAMQQAFSRMELVTREEFDTQAELLARTRTALERLEQQLTALEQSIAEQTKP